jgi:hypothetical protein
MHASYIFQRTLVIARLKLELRSSHLENSHLSLSQPLSLMHLKLLVSASCFVSPSCRSIITESALIVWCSRRHAGQFDLCYPSGKEQPGL